MTQSANAGEPNPYRARGSEESRWRRPDVEPPRFQAAPSTTPPYTGPPKAPPPPVGWRPPTLIQAPEARVLPTQDLDAIEGEERQAKVTTYGVGMITGAIALLVVFVLCARLVF